MIKLLSIASAILFFNMTAHAGCLDGNIYLWKTNGEPEQLGFYEALKACPSGKHLPSARELAKLSQLNGAKGIMEIDSAKLLGADPDVPPRQGANLTFFQKTGYDFVDTFIPGTSGTRDRFYFNPRGYKQPESIGCEGYQDVQSWSASIYVYLPNSHAYLFDGDAGELIPWNTFTQGSSPDNRRFVMCLPN